VGYRQFVRSFWPTLILGTTGAVAFGAGLAQQPRRDVFAGELVLLGIGSLVLSAFAPRIVNWEIGPKGVKAAMSPNELTATESSGYLAGEDDDEPGQTFDEDEVVLAARTALSGEAIAALLQADADSALHGMLLRLFLLDASDGVLVPVLRVGDPPPAEVERFRPGCGATGTAFARGEYVYVAGPAVSDATYGLTPEQQQHFQSLTAVGSMPVANASGRVLGVLTASTETEDGPERLASEDGFYDLLGRSMLLSRVLVDLLKWFDDGYALP
jgi:hypothetical protein